MEEAKEQEGKEDILEAGLSGRSWCVSDRGFVSLVNGDV